jgi:hypothetical protein
MRVNGWTKTGVWDCGDDADFSGDSDADFSGDSDADSGGDSDADSGGDSAAFFVVPHPANIITNIIIPRGKNITRLVFMPHFLPICRFLYINFGVFILNGEAF